MKFLSAAGNRAPPQLHDSELPCFSAILIKLTSDPGFLVTLFDYLRRVLQRLEARKSRSLKMPPQPTLSSWVRSLRRWHCEDVSAARSLCLRHKFTLEIEQNMKASPPQMLISLPSMSRAYSSRNQCCVRKMFLSNLWQYSSLRFCQAVCHSTCRKWRWSLQTMHHEQRLSAAPLPSCI